MDLHIDVTLENMEEQIAIATQLSTQDKQESSQKTNGDQENKEKDQSSSTHLKTED